MPLCHIFFLILFIIRRISKELQSLLANSQKPEYKFLHSQSKMREGCDYSGKLLPTLISKTSREKVFDFLYVGVFSFSVSPSAILIFSEELVDKPEYTAILMLYPKHKHDVF